MPSSITCSIGWDTNEKSSWNTRSLVAQKQGYDQVLAAALALLAAGRHTDWCGTDASRRLVDCFSLDPAPGRTDPA